MVLEMFTVIKAIIVMQKQTHALGKTKKGDTSRTSSQGRKLSSGGILNKKGNPEIDENTKSEKSSLKKTAKH